MVLSQSLYFGLNSFLKVFNYFLFITFLSKGGISMRVHRLAVKRFKKSAVVGKNWKF